MVWLALLVWLVPGHVRAGGPGPRTWKTADERRALAILEQAIEGVIVYSRPPRDGSDEDGWMIERVTIGDWEPQVLGPGSCARFSRDGQRLAVFAPDHGHPEEHSHGEVWVMDSDGQNPARLCAGAWSQAPRGACPLDFHPNLHEIWFIAEDGRIMAVDTRTARVRFTGLPGRYEAEIQLSGDGRWLVGRLRGRGDWAQSRRLARVHVSSGLMRIFAAGCGPAISPDGRWMTANHDGHNKLSVWYRDLTRRAKLDTARLLHPADGAHRFHWSNHNRWLAMSAEVYHKVDRRWPMEMDGYLLDLSRRKAIRFTFGHEAAFPDLFVTRDRASRLSVPPLGGRSLRPGQIGARRADPARIFRTKGQTVPDPGPAVNVPRIEVMARLVTLAPIKPFQVGQRSEVLREGAWDIEEVIAGRVPEASVAVAHWAVRHGQRRRSAWRRIPGQVYRLVLEPWHLHPELKAVDRRPVEVTGEPDPLRFVEVGR